MFTIRRDATKRLLFSVYNGRELVLTDTLENCREYVAIENNDDALLDANEVGKYHRGNLDISGKDCPVDPPYYS